MLTLLDRLLSAFSNTLPAAATGMPRLTGYPLGPYPRTRRRQGPRRRPRITPMAPSTSEPLRYPKPHHFQGLSPSQCPDAPWN